MVRIGHNRVSEYVTEQHTAILTLRTFKLAIMIYQCVRGLGLAYLADTLQPVAWIPSRQRLQSSSTSA